MAQTPYKPLALAALILAGGAMLATTVAAEARGMGQHARPSFAELDANGDGGITLEEIKSRGAARFANADADGDGALSRAELLAAGQGEAERRVDRMLARLDSDKDGSLSQAEMEAARGGKGGERAARMFERADADGDGTITAEEFAKLPQPRHEGGHKGKQGGKWHKN